MMSIASQSVRLTSPRETNFYYSFVFLPRAKRQAIEAVYAFARRGDDLVDGGLSPEATARELARYRQDVAACYSTNAEPGDGRLRVLAQSIQNYRIPRCYFEELILGLEMDMNGTRYESFGDLALYCYRVASTIGLISIEIFGYENPRTRDYAVNLGVALQLVNILRDLQSDARNGRVYLPREDLQRFGVQLSDLAAGTCTDSLIALLRFECDRARQYFDLARQTLPPEDRRRLIAAEIMAAIYWKLLRRIQQRCSSVFEGRVRLSSPTKIWSALSVYLGAEWHK